MTSSLTPAQISSTIADRAGDQQAAEIRSEGGRQSASSTVQGTLNALSPEHPKTVRWQAAWPLLRRFWPYMYPERRKSAIIAALLIFSIPTSVVAPFLVQHLIDEVLPRRDLRDIVVVSAQMVGLSILSGILGYAQAVLAIGLHNRVRFRVIRDLFAHVLRLPLTIIHKRSTGYLMSRIRDDVAALDSVMVDHFIEAAAALLKALTFLALLFLFDVGLALSGATLVAVILLLVAFAAPALRKRSQRARETDAESSAALHESLTGIATVRTAVQEVGEGRRYRASVKKAIRAAASRDVLGVFTGSVFGSMGSVGVYVIVAIGAYRISVGLSTFGSLFAFFVALMQVMMATGAIAAMVPGIQSSLASLERILGILDEGIETDLAASLSPPARIRGAVRFVDVSFRYEEGPLVIENLRLAAAPGTITALVGRSGAGKSTLVHLLCRLYDPVHGHILVDDRRIEEYPLFWLRERIGVVSQDVFLFDRTIRENIAYARPQSSEDAIREAAVAAHANEFICALREGYATVVGERGVRLSGGEKQRLAIARELLRDPPLLVLDEATSQLDAESEALVRDALGRLLAGRTCFVIAHRLSTVLSADQIAVLDRGQLVALGSHESLLKEGGLYRELYELQFRKRSDDKPQADPSLRD